jgi:hypothetical protein
MDVNHPKIESDDAKLFHDGFLKRPIEGVYEFESHKREPEDMPHFPRFRSYVNDADFKPMGMDKLTINSGFALNGSEIHTSSLLEPYSVIEARNKGVRLFKARGRKFNFEDSLITSDRVSLVIYHREDSIFHPGLMFDYNLNESTLKMVKDHSGFKHAPFKSTLFKMEIEAEMVDWDLDTDSLNLSRLNAKNQIPVLFESEEYFNKQRYNRLSGLYNFNPLLMAVGYSHRVNSLQFYSGDMARDLNQNPSTVKGAMKNLSQQGYIDYDPATDVVQLKRKAIHYYLSDRRRKDYDNVSISSLSPREPNATFSFEDESMTIRGVERFYLSEPLDVYITPENYQIKMLANRDFEFNGKINAGNFEYVGSEFRFDYDSFLVVMPKVDSLKFNVTSEFRDRNNKVVRENVSNQLVETGGVLYINHPKNKSALKNFPQYPVYDGQKGATVYFNSPDILNGAYDKSLAFSIPPFNIDSVSAANTNVIGFTGTFSSRGILPEFEDKIQIMPDRSLGFTHKLPEAGFDIFEGRAKVFGELKMDKGGLQVNGRMEFGPSTLYSDDFVIYQDSVIAKGSEVKVQEGMFAGVSFPETHVEEYHLKWYPYLDSLYVFNEADPIRMFNGQGDLNGYVIISQKGMYGGGQFLTSGSEINSDKYTFSEHEVSARNSDFEIKSDNPDKPALAGEDVEVNLDLTAGISDISPEIAGVAAIDFPYAQYKTSISNAEWDLNQGTVTMTKQEGVDIQDSYFYTTNEEMDSLVFNATGAVYDINDLTLNVSGIPYIVVADAKITPDNNEVLIKENADIQEFYDASLEIDTLEGYHSMIHGNIKIISRNEFQGDATYQYVNAEKDTFNIKMGSFHLEEEEIDRNEYVKYTVSSGEITALDNVYINPGMIFKGIMTMYANKPALELDGFVKLDLENVPGYDYWIQYKSSADVQEIIIPFDESVMENGDPLVAGLHYENSTFDLYSTFVTDKRTPGDEDFFIPSGQLRHDVENGQYVIERFEKSIGESYEGNTFIYNEESSDIKFEGALNFLGEYSDGIELTATGSGSGNLDKSEFDLNTLLAFEFNIPNGAVDAMGLDLQQTVEILNPPPAEGDKTELLYKLAPIIGDRTVKDYEEKSFEEYIPIFALSGKLAKDLLLTNVDFKWSESNLAWYSTSKIGVSNVKGIDINSSLDGFIEMKKDISGDIVNIFIQATPDTWYFFNYENNSLITYSSDPLFNQIINDKTNVAKAKIGEFVFSSGSLEETESFVNQFRSLYFGINDLYYLQMGESPVDQEPDAFQSFPEEGPQDEPPAASKKKSKKDKKKKDEEDTGFDPFGAPDEEEDQDDDSDGF